jgi:hypothetical protein
MPSFFEAPNMQTNFRCVRDGQSYYLNYSHPKFSISRFEKGFWNTEHFEIPSDRLRLSVRKNFLLGDTFVVFFFFEEALYFSFSTKTFRTIRYPYLIVDTVDSVFQTRDYFYLKYVDTRHTPSRAARSDFIPLSKLDGDSLYFDYVVEDSDQSYYPVFGDNNVVANRQETKDIENPDRPLLKAPLAIFDSTNTIFYYARKSNFYQNGEAQFLGDLRQIYVDVRGYLYSIFNGGRELEIKDTMGNVKKFGFIYVSKVLVDKNTMYLIYNDIEILALDLNDLENDRYRFVGFRVPELRHILPYINFGNDVLFYNDEISPRFKRNSLTQADNDTMKMLINMDPSTKLFFLNSSGIRVTIQNVHWMDCNITERDLIMNEIAFIPRVGNYLILDANTGLFL